MSMLAEPRIKQKWSLNPRGKAWSEDSNKFGQKMLEKMGWSKGKGLGAKENGMLEHVKISYKNDAKGMGYKERNDQWTEHDDQFNSLLQSLSGETPQNSPKLSSLEQKSQNSKVRVHYKKFTRGKDLSRCSAKDLANIFGRKSLEVTSKVPEAVEHVEDTSFIKNSGSMVDYFKQKLPHFGRNSGYKVGSNGVLAKESDSEEERVGFGMKRKSIGDEPGAKKLKIEDSGVRNPAFEPMGTKIEVNKHVLEVIEEENDGNEEIKRKKKKKKEAQCFDNEIEDNDESQNNNKFEVKRRKKKKQAETNENVNGELVQVKKMGKKKKKEFVNEMFDVNEEEEDTQDNNKYEVKRRKKKKVEENFQFVNNVFNGNEESGELQNNNKFEVKRRKKKKSEESEEAFVNLQFVNETFEDEETEARQDNNTFEVKRKKKKKQEIEENSEETQKDRKKKKTSEETNDEPVLDLILNVTSTPCVSTPAPPSASSVKRRKSVRFSDRNEERIIEARNELFDINSRVIENGLAEISQKIENCQAEIENDMNETKVKKQKGGGNVTVPAGTILKFSKDMKFGEVPNYILKEKTGAKKSYKHLIKGDILLEFRNTNLHEISGYAVQGVQ